MRSNSRKLKKTIKILFIFVITVLVSHISILGCSRAHSLNISFWELVLKLSQEKVKHTCSFGRNTNSKNGVFLKLRVFPTPLFFRVEVFQGTCQRCVNVRKKVLSRFEKLSDLAFTNFQISGFGANVTLTKPYRGSPWTLNGLWT